MAKRKAVQNVIAVDCCEHTLAALENLRYNILTLRPSGSEQPITKSSQGVHLIVIGVRHFPIRTSVINQLRRLYPSVPVLILRRESGASGDEEWIRGEFTLSDRSNIDDLDVVRRIRAILPLAACEHIRRGNNYNLAQEAVRVLLETYADTALDLRRVARELAVSPKRLSRVLNQEVGMSFRRLLRDIRVEEAKRMLTSRHYSIKEVAAHVGFSDGHYFSRSFKELTGQSASKFRTLSCLPR